MAKAIAIVPTEHASRYLQQLCKHWAHKFTAEFTPQHGTIDMGESRLVTMTADPDKLNVTVEAPEENIEKLEEVVAAHIVRFAFREELAFDWKPA